MLFGWIHPLMIQLAHLLLTFTSSRTQQQTFDSEQQGAEVARWDPHASPALPSHQIMGTEVRRSRIRRTPRSPPSSSFPARSRPQRYQLCQIHRQPRSGTLFLTCPSAPRGIPLMRHYGEQMQRGQPGQKQPATVT